MERLRRVKNTELTTWSTVPSVLPLAEGLQGTRVRTVRYTTNRPIRFPIRRPQRIGAPLVAIPEQRGGGAAPRPVGLQGAGDVVRRISALVRPAIAITLR